MTAEIARLLQSAPPAAAYALAAAAAALALLLVIDVARPARRKGARRLADVVAREGASRAAAASRMEERGRRRQIDETLRELSEKQKAQARARRRITLIARMRQGGLTWSRSVYLGVCLFCGAGALLLARFAAGLPVFVAAALAVAAGLLLPHLYVGHARARRFRAFMGEFPDAVDVIVRGVKSGMPIGDCLRAIASEGREPVKGEFKAFVDDQAIGLPLEEAIRRLNERAPMLEVNFFGIILEIQNRAGGNLSEALGNLARVLRDRKRMKAKIVAISAEAKASAAIIGALPAAVALLLWVMTPDYVELLFQTAAGKLSLGAAVLWMGVGVLVMRKMIRFDF
ncbi:MAG: pilus assembly protein [Rhodobacteraceae bacterium]|nr:MAG: pilus assembly protein [Paracoccaceae bacterium]